MNKIKNAIILNGPGRSGTTLVYQMLAYHEDLAWISNWVNRYPSNPYLSWFNRFYNHEKRMFPKPAEAYQYWKHFYGVSNNTIKKESIKKQQKAVQNNLSIQIQKAGAHKRFLTKITGHGRADLLDSLFEDYQQVWIDRDPRVVVSSYIKQHWFYRDKQSEFKKLTELEKIKFYSEYYLSLRLKEVTERSIVVKYEDLVTNKHKFFTDLLELINLEYTTKFNKIIDNWEMKIVDWNSYKDNYSPKGLVLLEKKLNPVLHNEGFI